MVGSKRYFNGFAYSDSLVKPNKNRHLRKDRRCIDWACLSRKRLMPLVHKQKFD